jgi:hypothetical protein
MADLQRAQIGWKGLQNIINQIIDEVNKQTPLAGTGIHTEDAVHGITISLANQTGSSTTSSDQTSTGGGGGVQDPHLLATSVIWYGVKWQDVIVVDPGTCAQSTLSVLVSTRDNNDSITIGPVKYPFWVQPI